MLLIQGGEERDKRNVLHTNYCTRHMLFRLKHPLQCSNLYPRTMPHRVDSRISFNWLCVLCLERLFRHTRVWEKIHCCFSTGELLLKQKQNAIYYHLVIRLLSGPWILCHCQDELKKKRVCSSNPWTTYKQFPCQLFCEREIPTTRTTRSRGEKEMRRKEGTLTKLNLRVERRKKTKTFVTFTASCCF